MIKKAIVGIMTGLLASVSLAVMPTNPVSAADCNPRFLTAPAWYRGVTDGDCNISVEAVGATDDELGGALGPFLLVIGLNIVEILMHVVAYISVGYIIYGGFRYMTSLGSSDGSVKARKTIQNAIIGLIISLIAVGVITFSVGRITG